MTLGLMDYNLGDKAAALADFRKALRTGSGGQGPIYPYWGAGRRANARGPGG